MKSLCGHCGFLKVTGNESKSEEEQEQVPAPLFQVKMQRVQRGPCVRASRSRPCVLLLVVRDALTSLLRCLCFCRADVEPSILGFQTR